jgi:hypothetical protein
MPSISGQNTKGGKILVPRRRGDKTRNAAHHPELKLSGKGGIRIFGPGASKVVALKKVQQFKYLP